MSFRKNTFGLIFKIASLLGMSTSSVTAAADILISFPSGSDPAWVAAVTKELEDATGRASVGIIAVDENAAPAESLPPEGALGALESAKDSYEKLQMERVLESLENAEKLCLDDAEFNTCKSFLFEVNLLRGMALEALGKSDFAAQAFRSAHIADRSKVIDPRLYPPRISRAYAKACSSVPAKGKAELGLKSKPEGALFRVDGERVSSARAYLDPGRHIVESEFVGYERSWKTVEVGQDGGERIELAFDLKAKSELDAWKTLTERVSSPTWHPAEPGVEELLERFKIEYVVRLKTSANSSARPETTLSKAGDPDLIIMPSLGRQGEPVSPSFLGAMRKVLGIPEPAVPEIAAVASGPQAEEELEELDGSTFDEEEDPSVRFAAADDASPGGAPLVRKPLYKSPWLWISVGVVAAIITGFAVTTSAAD